MTETTTPVPVLIEGPAYGDLKARTIRVDPALLGQLRILVLDKINVQATGTTYGTATDGLIYNDPDAARGQALAKSLRTALGTIAPRGTRSVIRVHSVDGKFRWVVTLAGEPTPDDAVEPTDEAIDSDALPAAGKQQD